MTYFLLILICVPFLLKTERWSGPLAVLLSLVILFLGKAAGLESTYIAVDEAQLIVQARLLKTGLLPWIDWDPTTSGPLNSLWPNLLNWITGEVTLAGARITATLLQWLSIVFLYLGLRLSKSPKESWLFVSPALICLSLNAFPTLDGVHTGVLPGFLFVLSFYFYERAKKETYTPPLIVSVLAAGAHLVTKIQTAPAILAFYLGILFAKKEKRWLSLSLVFLLPFILTLAPVLFAGGLDDFWESYILGNLSYGSGFKLNVHGLHMALLKSSQFPSFFLLALGFILTLRKRFLRDPYVLQFLVLLLAIIPSQAFLIHYLDILLYPLIIATSVTLSPRLGNKKIISGFAIGLLSFVTIWQIAFTHQSSFTARQYVSKSVENFIPPWRPAHVAIWGWMPEVYVLTETYPGTRDTITQFALFPTPRQSYYIERFIKDLEVRKPLWVLEVACREPKLRDSCRLENYPTLEKYLRENYQQMEHYENPVPNTTGLWKRN